MHCCDVQRAMFTMENLLVVVYVDAIKISVMILRVVHSATVRTCLSSHAVIAVLKKLFGARYKVFSNHGGFGK